MIDDWPDRLAEAVKRDGRSLRAISIAAGCGPNFLQQMLRDRKEPGIGKLLAILNTLGAGSTLYVVAGIDFKDQDAEFLQLALSLRPDVRAKAVDLLREFAVPSTQPQPQRDPAGES